jgi:predicted Zn-dependent protease
MTEPTRFQWSRPGREVVFEEGVARIRAALAGNPQARHWKLERQRTTTHQRYLSRTALEAVRRGTTETVTATVYVPAGDRFGTAEIRLRPGEEARAQERVAEAIAQASSAEVRAFPLPGPVRLPAVQTEDPGIAGDPEEVLEEGAELLLSLVAAERRTRLASAELFVSHDTVWFENSEGFSADRSGTRVTAEIVLIGLGDDQSEAETQGLRYRRRMEDLELAEWISDLASQARDQARARPLDRQPGAVVLGAESIVPFLGPIQFHTSAASSFQNLTTWEIGSPVSETPVRGDGISASHDALLPYGNQSAPCDSDGVPAQRTLLVEEGIFRNRWADLRHAHYLHMAATGQFANWVVEGGTRSVAELLAGQVLEIKRFSWLNPSTATGDFAAEVRFGYLHREGARTPIRGGSVAGNVMAALGDCAISRETRFVGNGVVPRAIRFHGLTVAV